MVTVAELRAVTEAMKKGVVGKGDWEDEAARMLGLWGCLTVAALS